MICQRCGRDNIPQVAYCQGCGTPLPTDPNPPSYTYPPYQAAYPESANYAGIGSRFLAAVVDGIVIGIPIGIVAAVLSAMMTVRMIERTSRDTSFNPGLAADTMGTFFAGFGFIMVISLIITWTYFAMMESSSWQGTLGKRMLGIKVTDLAGNRISLGKATIRLVAKTCLSGWFLIGYIMAFFTRRRQALHDMIAGTLVLTKAENPATANYAAQYPPQYSGYPQQPMYPPPPAAATCPHCGSALQPGSRFCSTCGQAL